MPLYLSKKRNVVFFHIPKTGGTSIESWLINSLDSKQILFHKFILEDMLVTPQHLGYSTIQKLIGEEIFAKSYKFVIVRNPFDRLESEFFYRVKMGGIKLGKCPERYFSSWLVEVLTAYRNNPSIYDNHFRPQIFYYGQDVNFFKFESGLDVIANQIAKTLLLTEISKMEHKKTSERKSVIWTKKAVEMAKEIYKEDFHTFNYSNDLCESNGHVIRQNKTSLFLKYKMYGALNLAKAIVKRLLNVRGVK